MSGEQALARHRARVNAYVALLMMQNDDSIRAAYATLSRLLNEDIEEAKSVALSQVPS